MVERKEVEKLEPARIGERARPTRLVLGIDFTTMGRMYGSEFMRLCVLLSQQHPFKLNLPTYLRYIYISLLHPASSGIRIIPASCPVIDNHTA